MLKEEGIFFQIALKNYKFHHFTFIKEKPCKCNVTTFYLLLEHGFNNGMQIFSKFPIQFNSINFVNEA